MHALLVEPIDVENSDILEECLEILKIKLLKLNTEPLKFICTDIGCLPVRRTGKHILKCDYAKALVAWWKLQPWSSGKPLPLKICTLELLCHIRAVVKNTVTPSWINLVPYNFRDPAAGTLKADKCLISLFGLVQSWWCFPFECLIGMLQWLPHNHKFGQFEPMMLQSFIRGGNLCCWLGSPDCPSAIKECKLLFDKVYRKQDDDSPDNQPLTGASQILPDNLRLLMKQHKGALASTHLGKSLILFYAAGCVQYIVLLEGQITFVVHHHNPAVSGIVDPFAPYPHFLAKLYSSQLVEHLEIVQVQWVLGHFAQWSISSENVVILNLTCD
ncbi:hypothetical protein K439DRAFT_1622880 [Ramaria rubella]|nr:hypothetical protein K439DRAFT_1622880 [Ramaria rubella]